LNTNYFIKIDTTGPVITFECLPPNVNPNEEVTCNCTATDAGIGINESNIEFSENPSTSNVGTFQRTCTAVDLLGNENSETSSYTVLSGTLYQGEDSNYSDDGSWIYTYSIDEGQFLQGYTQTLALKRKIEFQLGGETHSVGVLEVDNSSVKLEIASTPIEKVLEIGEEFKVDLSSDGFYDLYIILNGILNNNSANLSIRGLHESITGLAIEGNETDLNSSENQTDLEKQGGFLGNNSNKKKILIIGGIVVFLLVVSVIIIIFSRRNPKVKIKSSEKPKGMYQGYSEESSQEITSPDIIPDSTPVETEKVSQASDVSLESSGSDLSGTSRNPEKSTGSLDDIIKTHPDKESKSKTTPA
jgi:hypothetical protein